jgi:short-subunit dehydrogenase involved in D-alanine esterification of teichoic acids
MLVQSYAGIIRQNKLLHSLVATEPEMSGEMMHIQLDAELKPADPKTRPERIWDLEVSWFDDYLDIAAENAGVQVIMDLLDTRNPEESVLEHDINISINADTRMAMMSFFQEFKNIPAAYVIRSMSSVYDNDSEQVVTDITLGYYEKK